MKLWRCVWIRGEITSAEMTARNVAEAAMSALTRTGSSQAEAQALISDHTLNELVAAAERCIDVPQGGGGHGCIVIADSIEAAIAKAQSRHPKGVT